MKYFLKVVNNLNTLLLLLITAFPKEIMNLLNIKEPVLKINYLLIFCLISLSTLLSWLKKYKKQTRFSFIETAELIATAITITLPIFAGYLWYLDKNYGLNNPNKFIFLLPLGMTLGAAISQPAIMLEKKSKNRFNLYFIITVLALLLSSFQNPLIASLYFLSVFVIANFPEKNVFNQKSSL